MYLTTGISTIKIFCHLQALDLYFLKKCYKVSIIFLIERPTCKKPPNYNCLKPEILPHEIPKFDFTYIQKLLKYLNEKGHYFATEVLF